MDQLLSFRHQDYSEYFPGGGDEERVKKTRILNQIEEAAIMWNKTKDPYYKDLWYKLIREWAHGRTPGKIFNSVNSNLRWKFSARKVGV